jgi:hypothetical protein
VSRSSSFSYTFLGKFPYSRKSLVSTVLSRIARIQRARQGKKLDTKENPARETLEFIFPRKGLEKA